MTLYLIGIGLSDEKDITVKGLEAVKICDHIYLESYTSRLQCTKEDLEDFYGKDVILADRDLIETRIEDEILAKAKGKDVALLVIGDPFSATTHVDIMQRARSLGIDVNVINNASVLTAVGIVGLELYKYGKVTSIPFHNENVKAPIDVYNSNKDSGLHTLFLLDLDPMNSRYMTIKEACQYLISHGINSDTMCVGVAGLGSIKPEIIYATVDDIQGKQFSLLPQSLIIPGNLHFVEDETLQFWK